MEIKIVDQRENPILDRLEVRFLVSHPNAPTPRRSEVRDRLASQLQADPRLVVIEKMASLHGKGETSGIARIYKSEDRLKTLEPPYLLKRMGLLEEGKEQPETGSSEAASQKPSDEKPKEG
jgi:small subunit ribosomal protein S24e